MPAKQSLLMGSKTTCGARSIVGEFEDSARSRATTAATTAADAGANKPGAKRCLVPRTARRPAANAKVCALRGSD